MTQLRKLEANLEELRFAEKTVRNKLIELDTQILLAKTKLENHKKELAEDEIKVGDMFSFDGSCGTKIKFIVAQVENPPDKKYCLIILNGGDKGKRWASPDSEIRRVFGLQSRKEFDRITE